MRGLANRFRQGGMGVNGADQVFDSRLQTKGNGAFGHELGRTRTDDVEPEQLVVLGLAHNLYEPFDLIGDSRSSDCAEREDRYAHVISQLTSIGLGKTDAANFRIAVGARRHLVIPDRLNGASGQPFRDGNPLRR